MRSDRMLRRGYITKTSSQSSSAIKDVGDHRGGRSEGWHQLEPTQEIDVGRLMARDILFIFYSFYSYYQLTPTFGSQRSPHIKSITFTNFAHYFPWSGKRWLPLVTHVTLARDLTQFKLNLRSWVD